MLRAPHGGSLHALVILGRQLPPVPQLHEASEQLARRVAGDLVEEDALAFAQPGGEFRVLREVVVLCDGLNLRGRSGLIQKSIPPESGSLSSWMNEVVTFALPGKRSGFIHLRL